MRAFLVLAFAAAFATGGPAQAGPVTASGALGFESRYVFRGVQYAATSLQPSVTLGYEGFYFTAWANMPVGHDDFIVDPDWQEIDFVVGWSGPVGEVVSLDFGLTYYTYPNRQSGFFDVFREDAGGRGFDTAEIFGAVAIAAPLAPRFTVFHDFMFDTTSFQLALSHSIPLGGGFSLDPSGAVGYVIDDEGGTDYVYGAASVNLSFAAAEGVSIYAGPRFGGTDISGGSIYEDGVIGTTKSIGVWFGVGVTATF